MDKPCQVFNCDETGMPLSLKLTKVVTMKGDKHPYSINEGDKAQITVIVCCSAGGYLILPYVIFDRKFVMPELTDGEVPGTVYRTSSSDRSTRISLTRHHLYWMHLLCLLFSFCSMGTLHTINQLLSIKLLRKKSLFLSTVSHYASYTATG